MTDETGSFDRDPIARDVTTRETTDRPQLRLVNRDEGYPRAQLVEPTRSGYIHVAAAVEPRPLPLSFVLPNGRAKSQLLQKLEALAARLEALPTVRRVRVFEAFAMPPTARQSSYLRQKGSALHVPRFDVVALIETDSTDTARAVQAAPEYRDLLDTLRADASELHVTVARNVRRIGDVPDTDSGFFLFNYFVGDNRATTLELWEYLAGWYMAETGLKNSILLAPVEGEPADYTVINFAHWDESVARFLWEQFSKAGFRHYVLANLEANRVGSMPVLYRAAGRRAVDARTVWAAGVVGVVVGTIIFSRVRARRRQ